MRNVEKAAWEAFRVYVSGKRSTVPSRQYPKRTCVSCCYMCWIASCTGFPNFVSKTDGDTHPLEGGHPLGGALKSSTSSQGELDLSFPDLLNDLNGMLLP